MVELLLAGGVGTTASLVSQALVWLYQHQDVRADLIAHPEKLPKAVEEFLRYFSPTQALARTIAADTEFHGCPMSRGDRVLLAWASANRDPAQFSIRTRSTSNAGRTGTRPSASVSTDAPDPIWAGPWRWN